MKLPKLNQSVILVDSDFLIDKIKEGLEFYSDLYPERSFPLINLGNLINRFAENSRIIYDSGLIMVVFLYKLNNNILPHTCEPNNLFEFSDILHRPVFMSTEKNKFQFVSYFSDPEGMRISPMA